MWTLRLTVILSLGWQFLSHYAFIRETPQAVHAESWGSGGEHPVDATSSCSRWSLGKDEDSIYCWLQMPCCLTWLYNRLLYRCSCPRTVNRSIAGCTSHCSWSLWPPNLSISQSISISSLWDQHFIEAQNSELKTLINEREDSPGATVKDFHTHTPYEPLRPVAPFKLMACKSAHWLPPWLMSWRDTLDKGMKGQDKGE